MVEYLVEQTQVNYWSNSFFDTSSFPQFFSPDIMYTYHADVKQVELLYKLDNWLAPYGLFSLGLN